MVRGCTYSTVYADYNIMYFWTVLIPHIFGRASSVNAITLSGNRFLTNFPISHVCFLRTIFCVCATTKLMESHFRRHTLHFRTKMVAFTKFELSLQRHTIHANEICFERHHDNFLCLNSVEMLFFIHHTL